MTNSLSSLRAKRMDYVEEIFHAIYQMAACYEFGNVKSEFFALSGGSYAQLAFHARCRPKQTAQIRTCLPMCYNTIALAIGLRHDANPYGRSDRCACEIS